MKKIQFLLCVWIYLLIPSIAIAQTTLKANTYRQIESKIIEEKVFTFKAMETCNNPVNYKSDTVSYFIGLKTPLILPQDTSETFVPIYEGCSYYWHLIFDQYSNEDKIKILEELLQYESDIDLSGKKVCWYGSGERGRKPKTVSYTIQTEALYIITLLSMSNFAPYYCPYPVLVNDKTGKEINNNQKELKKVFKIYREWIKRNKKTGFKNFQPPLYKTNYQWYESNKRTSDVIVDKLSLPGIIIGKCK